MLEEKQKRQYLMIATGILIGILAVASVVYFMMTNQSKDTLSETGLPPFEIMTLEPSAMDQGLIPSNPVFTLETEKDTSEQAIQDNLMVSPKMAYTVKAISKTKFELTPTEPLEKGTMVSFKYRNKSRVAGWAFQVSDTLQIKSTYPAMSADRVPTNSGLEFTFNQTIDTSIIPFIVITPEIPFKATIEKDKLIMIPDGAEFEEDSHYSVAIKSDYVNGLGKSLLKDFELKFSTTGQNATEFYPEFKMLLLKNNEPILLPLGYGDSASLETNLYQISNASDYIDFSNQYITDSKRYKYPSKKVPVDKMTALLSESVPSYAKGGNQFAVLPDLKKGYYCAIITNRFTVSTIYFQVSDYDVYFEASKGLSPETADDHTLVWVIDSLTGEPVDNALTKINGVASVTTGADGTAKIPAVSVDNNLQIETKDDTLVLPSDFGNISVSDWYDTYFTNEATKDLIKPADLMTEADRYQQFFYTDRSVYQSNDTVAFFGVLKYKDLRNVGEVTVTLYNSDDEVAITQTAKATDIGTYQGEFSLKGLDSQYYYLQIRHQNKVIANDYVSIMDYVKPEFSIQTNANKEVLAPGEQFILKGIASNFDETPVSGMPLSLRGYKSYNSEDPTLWPLVTDVTGQFQQVIAPNYGYKDSKPFDYAIDTRNTEAENTDVAATSRVQQFPSEVIFDAKLTDNQGNNGNTIALAITTKALKLPLTRVSPEDLASYSGAPVDYPIAVEIKETYYNQVDLGSEYNPILKINEKKIRYDYVENTLETFNAQTVKGIFEYTFNSQEGHNYQVIARLIDTPNHTIFAESYSYTTNTYDETQEPTPTFSPESRVKLGENYAVPLNLPEALATSDNFSKGKTLFITYQDFYQNHQVVANGEKGTMPTFKGTFKDADIPNLVLKGIYHDGSKFYVGYSPPQTYIALDQKEKHLDTTIETNKERYRPGETVTVKLKTTLNGNPVASETLLNVVDEAYYALFPEEIDAYLVFNSLRYETNIYSFYHTNYYNSAPMAEMGEGDGNESYLRKDFKDNAAFTVIKTNESGMGEYSFKLPDNITSWRLTTHGVSGQHDLGTTRVKRIVTLPFYAKVLMGKVYIAGEAPMVLLRSGGSDIETEEPVQYQVTVTAPDGTATVLEAQGLPKTFAAISLAPLQIGQYTLKIQGQQGDFKDALEQKFEVVDSKVAFPAIHKTTFTGQGEGPVAFKPSYPDGKYTVSIWHKAAVAHQKALWALLGGDMARLEYVVAQQEAQGLLSAGDPAELPPMQLDLLEDFSKDGGLAPLLNAESDLRITVDTVALNTGYLDPQAATSYFYYKLSGSDLSLANKLTAYWGLACYQEPILYDLQKMDTKDFTEEEWILLANVYAQIGALQQAYEIYEKYPLPASGAFKAVEDLPLPLKHYFDLAALGSVLGTDTSEKWYEFATAFLPKKHVYQLQQLRYLKSAGQWLAPVTFTYLLDGKSFDFSLDTFSPKRIFVPKGQEFSLASFKGDFVVEESGTGTLGTVAYDDSGDYLIRREISATEMGLSDHITVKVTVNCNTNQGYEVLETIPSGFSIVEPLWAINQNTLHFYRGTDKNQETFTYTLKAKQRGTFTFEPSVMMIERELFLKTEPVVLTVSE